MTTTKRRMIDPTMTSGLRRAFTAELRRQFSGLKLDIVRYFEGEDFQRGLSFNVFCPTGEGGGVDPSCKKGDVDLAGGLRHFDVIEHSSSVLAKRWNVDAGVMKTLAKEDGFEGDDVEDLKRKFVYHYIRRWQGSSGGVIASEIARGGLMESGVDSVPVNKESGTEKWFDDHPGTREAIQDLGREMYKGTQEWLKSNGVTSVRVYRKGATERPFSSWTTSSGMVRQATAGREVSANIPARHILSVPYTGFGSRDEKEVVVLGGWHRKSLPTINTPSVDYFSSWLQSRLQERLTGPRQERLWEMLVEESFRRGAGRAYDDVVPRDFSKTKSEWDQASRAGFVRAIMGSGVQSLEIPLTANAFCPRGEGGGIDNSCPPTRSGSDSVQDPPVIDLEVYRGGGDKEGELVTYFTTRQDMAESYVDMYNDRYGAGGKLHKKSLSILSPARQDIIFSTAVSIGFDEDDITSGTPATIFDQEIHGRDKVKKLVDTLRKSGHDGAILDDIAYGKNIQDKAYIKFSNPEPKNQIPQVRLKKGQRLTALPKDGIRPLGSGMYIYTSGGASYQLKRLGNGKYLVTGARLTTNALPFFSGARRAFDSVKLLAQRAWTEFVGGVQGLANGLARTFLDGRVRDAKPQAVAREMSKQVERARIQSTTVVSDSVVRAFNEGILVAAIPLGVTEIGVAVEWRVRRNPDGSIAKNVCRACRDLEGVVLRPSEAKGLFPRHPRCQCSLVAITKASKDQKTSRGSVVSAIQRSRRRYKSAKAREWASRVKISERRPKLTKNVLVERIDRMLTGNVFCPTGQGGGVDPTCSPGEWVRRDLLKRSTDGKEHLAVTDSTGKVLGFSVGDEESVDYPPDLRTLVNTPGAGLTNHHTHPYDSPPPEHERHPQSL